MTNKRKSKLRPTAGKIHSIRQLGKAIGRSHTAACRWVSHPEWPFGVGPWPRSLVARMKTWAEQTLSPDFAKLPYLGRTVRKRKPPRIVTEAGRRLNKEVDRMFRESVAELANTSGT